MPEAKSRNGKQPIPVKNHEIVFEPPDDDTPGYLRLQRNVLLMKERLDAKAFDAKMIDDAVELLLPFVTSPLDREEAREGLLDLSKNQYHAMFDAVIGKKVKMKEGEVAVEVVPPV